MTNDEPRIVPAPIGLFWPTIFALVALVLTSVTPDHFGLCIILIVVASIVRRGLNAIWAMLLEARNELEEIKESAKRKRK